MLKKRREERVAAEHAQHQADAERVLDQARLVLERAQLQIAEPYLPGVVLKKGELVHLQCDGAGFIEPKRLPGKWAGGSHGVSFRVAKGVSYRVGASRGTFTQGAEVLQPTDRGRFIVTNQRCLFMGQKRTTEWAYAKLVGFSLEGDGGTAVFNVTNRQKASGVLYGTEREAEIEATIAAAIARFQGDAPWRALVAELEEAVADAEREARIATPVALPSTPMAALTAPPPTPMAERPPVPAAWHPDPSGRFTQRYWDGAAWTPHVVSASGEQSVDQP